jgi:hypothetical protein
LIEVLGHFLQKDSLLLERQLLRLVRISHSLVKDL